MSTSYKLIMGRVNIDMHVAVFYRNAYWLLAENFNGLFKRKIGMKNISFEGYLLNEIKIGKGQYDTVIANNGKLYFIPLKEKRVVIYHIEKGEFEQKYIENKYIGSISFAGAFLVGKYIFSFGLKKWIIMRIDTDTDIIDYVDFSQVVKDDDKSYVGAYYMGAQADLLEKSIVIPLRAIRGVIFLDVNTLEYNIKYIGGKEKNGFYSVAVLKDTIFLGPEEISKHIVGIDKNGNILQEIESFSDKEKKDTPIGLKILNENLYVFSKEKAEKDILHEKNIIIKDGCSFDYTFHDGVIVVCDNNHKRVESYRKNGNSEAFVTNVDGKNVVIRELNSKGYIWEDDLELLISMIAE